MALLGPTPHDIEKIHNEVNQYINHRFLVVMTAVTVFAAVCGIILTHAAPILDQHVSESSGTASSAPTGTSASHESRSALSSERKVRIEDKSILLIFYFAAGANFLYIVLFIVTRLSLQELMMLTSYLRVMEASGFERDYLTYEKSPYARRWRFGYDRVIVTAFFALFLMTGVLPLLLCGFLPSTSSPSLAFAWWLNAASVVCGISCASFVACRNFAKATSYSKWDEIWNSLKVTPSEPKDQALGENGEQAQLATLASSGAERPVPRGNGEHPQVATNALQRDAE